MGLPLNKPCPCGSMKKYKKCCYFLHNGARAKTALELMKSRYSAFALNNSKYIIKTTHKENLDYTQDIDSWTKSILDFTSNTLFESLQILEFYEVNPKEAYVKFYAKLSSQNQDISFIEKSKFLKEENNWKYHSGEIDNG